MSEEALRMARAEKAGAAMQEFVGPALSVIRAEYLAKLQDIAAKHAMRGEPLAMVEKLSTALKIVDQIEVQMRSLIADGEVANRDASHAGDMARLNTEERKWANF